MEIEKVAAITGATSGIGRATLAELNSRGYVTIANSRSMQDLRTLESEVSENGRRVHSLAGDASSRNMITEMFQLSMRQYNVSPDVLVLSAGHGIPGSLLSSDADRWDTLVSVNYLGVMHQLREAASFYVEEAKRGDQGQGFLKDIVVIGSTVGRSISAANPVYGSTKFAIHSLVESLRQEVCQFGIRVTLIEPGFVETNFQSNAGYDSEWFESIRHRSGPLLDPVDVAKAICFVVTQPGHVHIDDIRIRPTRQVV